MPLFYILIRKQFLISHKSLILKTHPSTQDMSPYHIYQESWYQVCFYQLTNNKETY